MKNLSNKKIFIVASSMAVLSLFILVTTPRAVSQQEDQLASIIFYGKIPGFSLKSKAVTPTAQQDVTEISGKYIISELVEEDFEKKTIKTKQVIFINGKNYELEASNVSAEIEGGIYEVKGSLDNKTNKAILVSTKYVSDLFDGVRLENNLSAKPREKKVAVFLFNYTDSSKKIIFPNEVENMMFGQGKFAQYYREASYDRQNISGDVFGWNTIPSPATPACQASFENFESAVAANQVDLNNYTNIVVISMCPGFTRNGQSNTSPTPYVINGINYNKVLTWVNIGTETWNQKSSQMLESMDGNHMLTNLEHLLIHEFGHAMGLDHAHGLRCEGTIPTDNCQGVGVGNHFDVMAYETIGLHFNAFAKAKLGWFSGTELKTITNSGVYTIRDLESAPTGSGDTILGNTKAYRIKPSANSNKTPIWIEFRKAAGFDKGIATPALGGIYGGGGEVPPFDIGENQNGIMLYKEGFEGNLGGQLTAPNARLMYLRNSPNLGTSANPYQVSLNPGQTFSDPRYGVTVTTLPSTSQDSRKFEVQMNPNMGCTRVEPALYTGFGFVPTTITRGSTVTIWVRLVNMDYISCPSSSFLPSLGSVPSGVIAANFTNNSVTNFLSNLAPDDERIVGLSIFVNSTTAVGQYNFPIILTNTTSGLSETLYLPINVI